MNRIGLACVAFGIVFAVEASGQVVDTPESATTRQPWRGLHVIHHETDEHLEQLGQQLPELAEMGLNLLIVEVNFAFTFESHPELRMGDHPITKSGASKLVKTCRDHGIRLIPQFQCIAHQSWAKKTFPLLTKYPQFDLTPGAFPNNEGLYCREWDPLNPEVNKIVFALIDELISVFEADAFHVGMDEIFLIGSEHSPSTKGKDPAVVLAGAINEYHGHLVTTRGVEMLMWGDRLIDGKETGYGKWEAAENGTAPAIDMIPKDIIICDWHYEPRESYPSIPTFLEKGFRVLPAGWRKVDATKALIDYSLEQNDPRMLGHLFTTWRGRSNWTEFPALVEGLKLLPTGDR